MQDLATLIFLLTEEKLLVKLSLIGYPRPTWGVKQAVRLVSELLLEDANLRITFSNLKTMTNDN